MNRLRAMSLMEISQVQYGFMLDGGTRNAIFVLRRLVSSITNPDQGLHI